MQKIPLSRLLIYAVFVLGAAALVLSACDTSPSGSSSDPENGPPFDEAPWPQFGFDEQNTGSSPNRGIESPEEKWSFWTGGSANQSAPVIDSSGTIYIGSEDDLYAVAPDGTEKWFLRIGRTPKPAIGPGGTIYASAPIDDKLYAVNPDGSEKWTLGIVSPRVPALSSDGTIYVGSGAGLQAISFDGSKKWTFKPKGEENNVTAAAIGPTGTIYVGFEKQLLAINPDGSLKWSFQMQNNYPATPTPPAVADDGTIYFGSNSLSEPHKLHAITPTGEEKWTFEMGEDPIYSTPSISENGTVYIGNDGGRLFAVSEDGTEQWVFQARGSIRASPSIDRNGTLYFGSGDSRLYAVTPEGKEKWAFQVGENGVRSPALSADQTIYVGSSDNNLYAIEAE